MLNIKNRLKSVVPWVLHLELFPYSTDYLLGYNDIMIYVDI